MSLQLFWWANTRSISVQFDRALHARKYALQRQLSDIWIKIPLPKLEFYTCVESMNITVDGTNSLLATEPHNTKHDFKLISRHQDPLNCVLWETSLREQMDCIFHHCCAAVALNCCTVDTLQSVALPSSLASLIAKSTVLISYSNTTGGLSTLEGY